MGQRTRNEQECSRIRPPRILVLLVLAGGLFSARLALATAALRVDQSGRSPQTEPKDDEDSKDLQQLDVFAEQIRQDQLEEVKPLLQAFLQEHPNSWRTHYQLGYVLYRLHDIKGSIVALSKSLQLNVENAEAHKILGLDLSILGDYDRAQVELEQAAAMAPDSADIRYFLGRVYYTKNIFPLARREFEAAIKLNPDYMKAYDNLGLTLEAVGENEAAVENWLRAVKLSEEQGLNSEWPFINLAAYYNRQNDPQQALNYSQKAAEKNPASGEAYFQMGRALRSRDEWEQAADALKKATTYNPENAEYHYVLSMVYRKLGKVKEGQVEEAAFRRLKQKESTAGLGGISPGRMDHRPPVPTVDRNE